MARKSARLRALDHTRGDDNVTDGRSDDHERQRSDASPDFLVSLYGPSLQDVNVPAHAPPLFIAVGLSHFNVTNGCLALFAAWKAAGKPAEIHVYDQVSTGFGRQPA